MVVVVVGRWMTWKEDEGENRKGVVVVVCEWMMKGEGEGENKKRN